MFWRHEGQVKYRRRAYFLLHFYLFFCTICFALSFLSDLSHDLSLFVLLLIMTVIETIMRDIQSLSLRQQVEVAANAKLPRFFRREEERSLQRFREEFAFRSLPICRDTGMHASVYRLIDLVLAVAVQEHKSPGSKTSLLCRLHGCQRDGVNDIIHKRTPGEIVHRALQSLKHRTDTNHVGAALNCLVGCVSGVQVRKDEYGGATRYRALGGFRLCYVGHKSSVILKRPINGDVGSLFLSQFGCFPHFFDVDSRSRVTG